MKFEFLKQIDESSPLILVFLGYSFTPDCLKHLKIPQKCDLCVVYDYTDLEIGGEFKDSLKGREIYLLAWSMGVWAANLTLGEFEFKKCVAINGTPFGIDEKFGITRSVFENEILKFDFENFKKLCFLSDLKSVNFSFSENPKAELEAIFRANSRICENKISWDKVYISKKDFIFPPKACEWFECEKIYLNAPHFVFFKFSDFGEFFEI
ncbi:MAG: DUF452 family protein [Campylobacter sp.]|nr:DUF452 family protein [Campylobacter sp.]